MHFTGPGLRNTPQKAGFVWFFTKMAGRAISMVRKIVCLFLLFNFLISPAQAADFVASLSNPLNLAEPIPLPAEHVRLEKFIPGSRGFFLHLQTAHGDVEAQHHLEQTLRFLEKKYSIQLLLVEGSAVPLRSEFLQMIPEQPEDNREILNQLAHHGLVKAPELFLSDYPQIETAGIENAALYRANLESYLKVRALRHETENFLKKSRDLLLKKQSQQLTPEIRQFLRQKLQFEEQILPLSSWLQELFQESSETLGIHLENPLYQFDWPMLTRYFFLHPPHAKTAVLSEDLQRKLIGEISGKDFFEELEKLSQMILEKKSPKEKNLFKQIHQFGNLKKILSLSLSREEWSEVQSQKEILKPSIWLKSLNSTETVESFALYDKAFETALTFYENALAREDAMKDAIQSRLEKDAPRVTVLITGGFHSAFVEKMVEEEDYSYLLASPLIKDSSSAADVYEDSILKTSVSASTLETAPFLALSEKDLERQGINPEKLNSEVRKILMTTSLKKPAALFPLLEKMRARWTPSNRSEVRTEAPSFAEELTLANKIIFHYPENGPNDPYVQIEALLTILYGGSIQYYENRSSKTESNLSQVRGDNLQGLLSFLKNANTNAKQRTQAADLSQRAVEKLKALGFRAGQRITVFGKQSTIGETLARDPRFESSFLHTFLGSRFQKLPNRLDTALETYKAYLLAKEGKSSDEVIETSLKTLGENLRRYEHIFQPKIPTLESIPTDFNPNGAAKELQWLRPYAMRAQHNDENGPHKGGIRALPAFWLKGSEEFNVLSKELIEAGLNLIEMRYFLRKHAREEDSPLAFGMTSKTAAYHLPLGGGKGTVLLADFFLSSEGKIVLEDLSHHFKGSPQELRDNIFQNYAKILFESGFIGPYRDIPAPDANTGSPDMNHMTETLLRSWFVNLEPKQKALLPSWFKQAAERNPSSEKFPLLKAVWNHLGQGKFSKNHFSEAESALLKELLDLIATFTAKSLDGFGSPWRVQSTGDGAVRALKKILLLEIEHRGGGIQGLSSLLGGRKIESFDAEKPLKNLSAKVVGFGNAGQWLVHRLLDEGSLITGISEGPFGVVLKPEGFTKDDVEWLAAIKKTKGDFHALNQESETEKRGIFVVSESDFIEEPADIYVLAARENTITAKNVKNAAGWIFLEIANGGITQEAYEELSQWATVITDTIANAGGVIVSYFEWLQNIKRENWDEATVIQHLEKQMDTSIRDLSNLRWELSLTLKKKVAWRTAVDIAMIRSLENAQIAETKQKTIPSKKKVSAFASSRSEVRKSPEESLEILLARLKNEGVSFVPSAFRKNKDLAIALLGPEVIPANPLTWPPAPKIQNRISQDLKIPSSKTLRARLGLKPSEAYLIGKNFALDYGAIAVLRKIIGEAPGIILTKDTDALDKIAALNKEFQKRGESPLLVAPNVEKALEILKQKNPSYSGRYAGIFGLEDLSFLEGDALKENLNHFKIDWILKTPHQFSRFLEENNLDTLVKNFLQAGRLILQAA